MAGIVHFYEDQHYKNSIKNFQALYFSYDILKREKNVVLGNILFEMVTFHCDHLPELLKKKKNIYIYIKLMMAASKLSVSLFAEL